MTQTTITIRAAADPPPRPRRGPLDRALLASGALAGPLFVATFLIEGATRAQYDPLRHPVSSLELGPYGWVQTANFLVSGVLALAFAVGLRRVTRPGARSAWAALLVSVWAVGLLGAGLFTTDPIHGYPPGAVDAAVHSTLHGRLHDLFSLAGFVALVAACFVAAIRFRRRHRLGWAAYSAGTGVLFVVAFVLATAGFSHGGDLAGVAGLAQRVMATAGWFWLSLLALHELRRR
jgi:hypothetical membrane protein